MGESLATFVTSLKSLQGIEGLTAAAADQTPRRLTGLFLNENQLAAAQKQSSGAVPEASWRSIGALASYALLELKAHE